MLNRSAILLRIASPGEEVSGCGQSAGAVSLKNSRRPELPTTPKAGDLAWWGVEGELRPPPLTISTAFSIQLTPHDTLSQIFFSFFGNQV